MPFEHVIRPRFAEVDAQGVVFNAHWLTFCDDAFTRFFEHIGFDPKNVFAEDGTFDCMLVAAKLEWQGSAGFDDVVKIAVEPMRLGRSSFDVRYTARVDGDDRVCATITYVSISRESGKATPIPDVIRGKLQAELVG